MGRTPISGLIARGQNQNSYNNSGIDTPAKWVDSFNAALQDLVQDIGLRAMVEIPYVPGTTSYQLPDDFFEVEQVWDNFWCRFYPRQDIDPAIWNYGPYGFDISFDGTHHNIDFGTDISSTTFRVYYIRYPALLTTSNINVDTPEVPTIGENALILYAIAKGLRNNNQPGQATNLEQMYENERKKIRDEAQRRRIGG
ncbi:hypothetical protein [Cohnella zeiphila]|uniref:Uncharacterized protein n=1 Tax=Cohnella zeiphila TaxID=2761120 RepID=A0A7X0VVZ2_9BACL|nr:hypothetical protein [Cohnella zeiphila]MBB6731887.1 hypothetical protein [Cohnella zeiphila]